MTNPTQQTYEQLNQAYAFFNERLFDSTLPGCLITMQRKRGAYGYFANQRFGTRDETEITDEIALNPSHFKERTPEQILSTLVHEMVHLWQFRFGNPSRTGYHNKEWAAKMKELGLPSSSTGQPGGKETGQRVSHYIDEQGLFIQHCCELLHQGVDLPYIEVWNNQQKEAQRKKAASKTKYSCHTCGMNAWAKPNSKLICGACLLPLAAEAMEDNEEVAAEGL